MTKSNAKKKQKKHLKSADKSASLLKVTKVSAEKLKLNKAPDQNDTRKPRVISLFAGCGGLDLGFHKAGYEIVYANDIDPAVKETYEYNLGTIDIRDIRTIKKSELPDADVVLAGIPCQPFSNAGNRRSTADDRGTLFGQVLEVVDEKAPAVVVFENVRGFLSSKDDNGTPMPLRLQKELKRHGYDLYYQLVNASDYGVPQNRYRVFLIGVKSSSRKSFVFPTPIPKTDKLTVGHVIGKPMPKDEQKEVWELSPQSIKLARHIPEGGSWKSIPEKHLPPRLKRILKEMKRYHSPNFYRRFSREEIMGTITAAGTPENSGIIHPLENRRYSVREIARFQSFPDDFKFIGPSVSKKYKMIGNAVPSVLAYHIANSIKEQLFDLD
ncbi:MAG: DNA (cytosine-5-)-methyltransferase [Alphaproteobacteria bacterium]|nr:DNA (cytosine-5-)-methyltransferase [Alphaproteobacteria bacterium]